MMPNIKRTPPSSKNSQVESTKETQPKKQEQSRTTTTGKRLRPDESPNAINNLTSEGIFDLEIEIKEMLKSWKTKQELILMLNSWKEEQNVTLSHIVTDIAELWTQCHQMNFMSSTFEDTQ